MNHQMAILPDESVAFYAYGSNGCDDIKERAPNGTVKTVVNSKTALSSQREPVPPQQHPVFAAGRFARVLGPAEQPDREGQALQRTDGLDPQRPRRDDHGRDLDGRQPRHSPARPRSPLFFNNNNGGPAGSIAQEIMINGTSGTKGWIVHGQPGDRRTWSWATCSAWPTATPSSATRPGACSTRSTPPGPGCSSGVAVGGHLRIHRKAGHAVRPAASLNWPADTSFGYKDPVMKTQTALLLATFLSPLMLACGGSDSPVPPRPSAVPARPSPTPSSRSPAWARA